MSDRKKALVVEDNALNMKLFAEILKHYNFEVIEINDGTKVKKSIYNNVPDIIIMDIQLGGTSGLDIIKTIKEDTKIESIPTIAVTAFAMQCDEEEVLASGFDAFITKPINIEEFIGIIEKLV